MLIQDPDLVIAIIALTLVVINSLFIWSARRKMNGCIRDIRQEMRVNNLATYGLAHHLRHVQSRLDQSGIDTGPGNASLTEADELVDRGVDTLQLADELGVSQNEAEIITHLRPTRLPRQAS